MQCKTSSINNYEINYKIKKWVSKEKLFLLRIWANCLFTQQCENGVSTKRIAEKWVTDWNLYLGHGFLILYLSKLSRGHFEQSVGRGNKEKIKNFFIPQGSIKEKSVGQKKNKRKFNDFIDSISFVCSNILDWIEIETCE